MHELRKVAVPLLLLLGASAAGAQDTTPTRPGSDRPASSATSVMPVTDARSVIAAKDDQAVKLRGKIVKQESGNDYLFTDSTGNVLVEISDKLLKGNKLAAGTEIEIEGKVETRLLRDPKVEARSVTVLARSNPAPLNREPGSAPEERG